MEVAAGGRGEVKRKGRARAEGGSILGFAEDISGFFYKRDN